MTVANEEEPLFTLSNNAVLTVVSDASIEDSIDHFILRRTCRPTERLKHKNPALYRLGM